MRDELNIGDPGLPPQTESDRAAPDDDEYCAREIDLMERALAKPDQFDPK